MSGAQRRISELLVSSVKHHRNRFILHESWTHHNAGASALQVRHAKKAFRKVEVILTESIKNLGAAGEIVEVAPGYARNYLCPQLKAMPAIEKYINLVKENLKYFPPKEIDQEELLAEKQAKEETEKRKKLDKMLKRLDSRKVVVYCIVKDKVNLRFPVTVKDIVREVRKQLDIELIDAHVDLIEDITTLGEFEVPLRLPPGLRLPGGRERLYLKVRTRRKNRIHNTETVLPKKGVLHPRYLNPDGTLKKKKKKVEEPTSTAAAPPDQVTE